MGGLSYFEEGGSTDEGTVIAKPSAGKGAYAVPTVSGNIPVGQGVLDAMEQLYYQKMAQQNSFMEAMKDAQAWWSGGMAGPAEALSRRQRDREAESASMFQLQSQLAQYRAAMAAQKAFEDRRAKELGLGGAQPGMPAGAPSRVQSMFGMPAEIRQALSNAKTEADYNKIYSDWAKKRAEVEANPEYDVPKIPVVIKAPDGSYYRDVISARQLRADPERYIRQDQGPQPGAAPAAFKPGPAPAAAPAPLQTAAVPAPTPTPALGATPAFAPAPTPAPAAPIQTASLAPETMTDGVDLGPEATTLPSTAGAPAPAPITLAKTFAQPGQSAAGQPQMIKTAAVARGRPPTAAELEQQAEIEKSRQVEENKAQIQAQIDSEKKAREKFIGESSPAQIAMRTMRAQRIQQLVAQDPKIAGILSQTGYASALGGLLSQGISTPSGPIGFKGISDAIAKTMPGMNMAARRELAQHLANLELDAAQMMQGQGQISDSERVILQNSSIGIDDPATLIHKTARILERRQQMMKQMREIYGAGDQWKRFAQFENSPRAKAVIDQYLKDITSIANSESQLGAKGPAAAGAYADKDKEARYQAWKRSQGQK